MANGAIILADSISPPSGSPKINPADFSLVQLFDLGWVFDPGYQRLLDNLAASPGAFSTVRVMKPFTNGIATAATATAPAQPAQPSETGIGGTTMAGNVWPASGAIDLSGTLNGLYELTRRNLIPFVVLGFFPDGIYQGIIDPPSGDPTCQTLTFVNTSDPNWLTIRGNWKNLVKAFFAALLSDTRFGARAIAQWYFEVWNEPDFPPFWGPDSGSGNLNFYQDLYKATCEVVTANGYKVQLGGPTVTTGFESPIAQTLQPFISFIASNRLPCSFLSFHGKGGWDFCLNARTYMSPIIDTAGQIAQLAKTAGLSSIKIINDEADMRANFAAPFLPRMTEQYPAWLTALMINFDGLNAQYPFEFMTGSDNAELPLVGWLQQSTTSVQPEPQAFEPAAFGQQRSIMTAASLKLSSTTTWNQTNLAIDLLKLPVYNFYELLRLLGTEHGTPGAIPIIDSFHMITVATTHVGSVFCRYVEPTPGTGPGPRVPPLSIKYSIGGITWPKINWYQFQIDDSASNGYAQAGGSTALPDFCLPATLTGFPTTSVALPFSATTVRNIRQHQELAVVNHAIGVSASSFNPEFALPPNTTTVFWITEYDSNASPTQPQWATNTPYVLDVTDYGTNVVLFWQPDTDPTFYSYQVFRVVNSNPSSPAPLPSSAVPVSPVPLRSALWVDTEVTTGSTYTYYLKTLNASGGVTESAPLIVQVT